MNHDTKTLPAGTHLGNTLGDPYLQHAAHQGQGGGGGGGGTLRGCNVCACWGAPGGHVAESGNMGVGRGSWGGVMGVGWGREGGLDEIKCAREGIHVSCFMFQGLCFRFQGLGPDFSCW